MYGSHMNIIELLRDAINDAIAKKYGTLTALAKKAGVSQGTLSLFVNGKRDSMNVDTAWKILSLLGYEIGKKKEDSYTYIPKVEAQAGAGSSLVTSDEVLGYYAFRNDFLYRVGIKAKDSVMMGVIGRSMEPFIRNQDTILVDQSVKALKDGDIFLVGLGDELLVKLVQKTPRGWLLKSENKDFSDIPVEGSDLENFRVYGRVRWFGRVL